MFDLSGVSTRWHLANDFPIPFLLQSWEFSARHLEGVRDELVCIFMRLGLWSVFGGSNNAKRRYKKLFYEIWRMDGWLTPTNIGIDNKLTKYPYTNPTETVGMW